MEDEETYEPPEDPDSGIITIPLILRFLRPLPNVSVVGLSLEELGMRALERLPRDRAIDGIHAFNGMRLV